MRRSLYTSALAVVALESDAIATDTTTAGETVDLNLHDNRFRDSVLFVMTTGTITDGEYVVTLEESDNDSDYTAVPADRVQGTLPTITDSDSDKLYQFGYTPGTARYVRLSIESTDTETGGTMSAVAVMSGGSYNPVARS